MFLLGDIVRGGFGMLLLYSPSGYATVVDCLPSLDVGAFFARGYVPAGTPELYREPLRSGWLYRESDLYRQERASSQSTLPSGGLRVF